MTLESLWKREYGILNDFVSSNPEIHIGQYEVHIPEDQRDRFYKCFDNVRMSIVEGVAMIAAEELGLEATDISIDYDPNAMFVSISGGADGLVATGWVLKECCQIFRQRIFEAAIAEADKPAAGGFGPPRKMPPNPLKGRKPEDLDLSDGKIVLKSDKTAGVPIKSLTSNVYATFAGHPPAPLWPSKYDTLNTLYCEVAVDTETGQVEILRYGAAVDSGKVIRRISLEGQLDQVAFFSQGCQGSGSAPPSSPR